MFVHAIGPVGSPEIARLFPPWADRPLVEFAIRISPPLTTYVPA